MLSKKELYEKSEAIQNLLSCKEYKEQWDNPLYDSGIIINPNTNEEMEIIMIGDDECFDVNEFYQFVVDGHGDIYKCYFDFHDEDGNEIDDLGCLDYSHPYRMENVTSWYA